MTFENKRYGGKKLLFLLAITLLQSVGNAQSDKIRFRITNKLGVETELDVYHVRYGSSIAEELVVNIRGSGNRCTFFLLEIGKGAYIAIPFSAFKEARLENGLHTVVLTTGKTYTGKLTGTLVEDVSGSPREYALQSTTNLIIQTKPAPGKSEPNPNDEKDWTLGLQELGATFSLKNPRFGFSYLDSYDAKVSVGFDRYVNERVTRTEIRVSPSFIIQVGAEQIPASIKDFAEISFKVEKQSEITLTSSSGVKTSGVLILKSGQHAASAWALMAEIVGQNGAVLILSSPSGSIKRSS